MAKNKFIAGDYMNTNIMKVGIVTKIVTGLLKSI